MERDRARGVGGVGGSGLGFGVGGLCRGAAGPAQWPGALLGRTAQGRGGLASFFFLLCFVFILPFLLFISLFLFSFTYLIVCSF